MTLLMDSLSGCEHYPPELRIREFIVDTSRLVGNLAQEIEKELRRQGLRFEPDGRMLGRVTRKNIGHGRIVFRQEIGRDEPGAG